MRLYSACLVCCLVCTGCHTLNLLMPVASDPDSAEALWRSGQTALTEGKPDEAISFYERSLKADPSRTRNHLSLAAAHLEAGNQTAACEHLGYFLADNPNQPALRAQYAELLLGLGRGPQARMEFARFVAEAQDAPETDLRQRIHAHGRLMELAEEAGNQYEMHLERGIGLFLLACCRAELDQPEGEMPAEGLLCKAAGELTVAHNLCPENARPCWYLHLTWGRLGQKALANRWLHEALSAAPHAQLTPAEQRSLEIAVRHHEGSTCVARVR